MNKPCPDDYRGYVGVAYENGGPCGFVSAEMLHFLKGRPWDEIALAYVHGLRPSFIRVTRGEWAMDARTWRVSVLVDEHNIIQRITQEIQVRLPDGVEHGHHLRALVKQ